MRRRNQGEKSGHWIKQSVNPAKKTKSKQNIM